MPTLDRWERNAFSFREASRPVYRRGSGPGVVIMHEIPGLTPKVIGFADKVVDAGFTVVLPQLFGEARAPPNLLYGAQSLVRACFSREFTTWRLNQTSPVVEWLRALARQLRDDLGGPVGAVGMCLTGGFALAMTTDDAVSAPVMAQPSLPIALTPRRRSDLNLSPSDLTSVQARCARGDRVLGVRYRDDWRTGTRFATLQDALGAGFLKVELAGRGHSTLTEDRDDDAVAQVISFLHSRIAGHQVDPPPS